MSPVPTDRHPGGPIPLPVWRGIRVVAGSFLLATGAAKVPILPEVGNVVSAITGWGEWWGRSSASVVIGMEVTIGGFLLCGVAVRAAATAGSVLMILFSGGIGSLLLRGVEMDCRCFGVIGIHLPLWAEFLLDLFLCGTFLLVRRWGSPAHAWNRRHIAAAAIILLSSSIAGLSVESRRELGDGREYLRRIGHGEGERPPRILLVLDHRSLACALCFDDFTALCDSLSADNSGGWDGALTLIRRDSSGTGPGSADLVRWGRETGIGGEIRIVDGPDLDPPAGGESVAYLFSNLGVPEFAGVFPLGLARRREFLAIAEGN